MGAWSLCQRGDPVHVEYYLFRYVATTGPGEGREARWCSLDEAMTLIVFQDARDLLKRSMSQIDPHQAS